MNRLDAERIADNWMKTNYSRYEVGPVSEKQLIEARERAIKFLMENK